MNTLFSNPLFSIQSLFQSASGLVGNTQPSQPILSARHQQMGKNVIIAIGGGKGGVGKSFFASSLGIYLSLLGKKTILVDADLGGANLHTWLGIPPPPITLSDYLSGEHSRLSEVVQDTPWENLRLIAGGQDFVGNANPTYSQKSRLMGGLRDLETDYIILDLGAGTHNTTLDLFLLADKGVLVIIPEPTSIENAYLFIKSALYRKLKNFAVDARVRMIIEKTMQAKDELNIHSPVDLINFIQRNHPSVGNVVQSALQTFQPHLVLNQVRVEQDKVIGPSICNACSRFFGLNTEYLGYLEDDDKIWQSVCQRRPLMTSSEGEDVDSPIRNLQEISQRLIAPRADGEVFGRQKI